MLDRFGGDHRTYHTVGGLSDKGIDFIVFGGPKRWIRKGDEVLGVCNCSFKLWASGVPLPVGAHWHRRCSRWGQWALVLSCMAEGRWWPQNRLA